MNLRSIIINGYKSVRDTTIELDHDCTILVGKNESGKSSILQAAALLPSGTFLQQDIHFKNEVDGKPDNENSVVFVFDFSDDEIEELIRDRLSKIFSPGLSDEIVVFDTIENLSLLEYAKKYQRSANFTFKPGAQAETRWYYSSAPEGSKLNSENYVTLSKSQAASLVSLDEDMIDGETIVIDISNISSDATLPDPNVFSLEDLERKLGVLYMEFVRSNSIEAILWSYENSTFMDDSIDIDAFITDPTKFPAFRNLFLIAGKVDPAKTAEKQIKSGTRNVKNSTLSLLSKSVTNYLNKTWKEYDNVKITVEYDQKKLSLLVSDKKEDSNMYTPSQRSYGFKKFILFLLHIAAAIDNNEASNKLLLIDEPEIGLHPTATEHFRDKLIELSNRNGIKIIYSTHSEHAIDPKQIERHYVVTKENEETSVNRAGHSSYYEEQVLLSAIGSSTFRKIQQNNLIFEGWTDHFVFMLAINTKRNLPKVSEIRKFYSSFGKAFVGGARDVKNFVPIIQLANRNCFILSDSDNPSKEAKKLFEAKKLYGNWTTYADALTDPSFQTLEDFLEQKFWKSKSTDFLKEKKIQVSGLDFNRPRCQNFKKHLSENSKDRETINQLLRLLKNKCFDKDFSDKDLNNEYFSMLLGAKSWIESIEGGDEKAKAGV